MTKYKKILFNLSNKLIFVVVGKLLTLLSLPIITRALGPSQFGLYNLSLTIASYSVIFANWGFLAKGIRDIAKDNKSREEVVNQLLAAKIMLGVFGGIVTIIASYILYDSILLIALILLALLSNIGIMMNLDFYFYGLKNTFIPSLSNLIGQIVFIILTVLFVNKSEHLSLLLFFNLLYCCIEIVIQLLVYERKNKIKLLLSTKNAFQLLKNNFGLGLGSKASFLQSTFPLLIIPVLGNNYKLGIFSAAFKFFMFISILFQTFGLVFSPWIVQAKENSTKHQKDVFLKLLIGYCLIGISCAVLIIITSNYLTQILFGPKFSETKSLVNIIAIMLIPLWALYSLLITYINNYEYDKIFLKGSVIQSLVIVTLSPILMTLYDVKGVIWGIFLSTLIAVLIYGKSIFKRIVINQ